MGPSGRRYKNHSSKTQDQTSLRHPQPNYRLKARSLSSTPLFNSLISSPTANLTMANTQPMRDMAAIARARGLRPLNAQGTLLENGYVDLPSSSHGEIVSLLSFVLSAPVAPDVNDAILLVEDDVVVHLPATLHARQDLGWAPPAQCIILRVNGLNKVRCLVGVPTGFAPETILVRTLNEFRSVL
ncbi:hypothetical protein B0H16DRAFT_1558672 [Mycena metata]|uniref:Uncharacterized protein n=1 Tax=Mycena metata TaxID=1033252 RepID=A0AAD7IL78_9AGAR|nr:hypothetical protein B0H16DRAFT_1631053 [Mycena metata]KAJ7745380.1 hypothetical protein B0H16DRAFT_1558672 [Mycena metata]